MKLESDNDNYYRCRGELLSKNYNLREIAIELPTKDDGDCMSMLNNDDSACDCKNASFIDEREESVESFGNLIKGYLVKSASRDRREKLHDKIDILLESTLDSFTDREMLEIEEEFHSY